MQKYILLFFSVFLGFAFVYMMSFFVWEREGSGKTTDLVAGQNKNDEKQGLRVSHAKSSPVEDKVKPQDAPVSFLFAGDVMLDRSIREVAERRGVEWLTENLQETLLAKDVSILNLEGPVTTRASISMGTKMGSAENYRFTFDPKTTKEFLAKNNFSVVNIGNNHIGNFGAAGISETEEFLGRENVGFFGDPLDESKLAYRTTVRGKNIAFVSYNEFGPFGPEKIVDRIQKEHTLGNIVFVYCHWGVEYALRENERQRTLAHAFIDAGADAVIGSHPHVVEPIEVYKGKAIFYSLGNFVFDQYFSDDTREGLLLGVEAGDDAMKFSLAPIWTEKDGRVRLSTDPHRAKLLERIAQDSTVDESTRAGIKEGMFSL